MKVLLASIVLALSFSASATNLRDLCENAYYADAGGVTELHKYQAIVEFGKLSDHLLTQIEDLIYGEGPLKMTEERDFVTRDGRKLTTITLKEVNANYDRYDYIKALEDLSKFPGVVVRCK